MKILFCGDVVGRPGRDAVRKHVPCLRRELDIDLVVVNAENAAGGFGLTERLCGEFYDCGVDVLTTGNHVWADRYDRELRRPFRSQPREPPKL